MKQTKLTGRIVVPSDPDYDVARMNLNLSIPKLPCIIVFCQNKNDVCNALKWAPYIDKRLTSSIELFSKQQNKIEVKGEFVGPPSELHSLLSPLLETGSPSLFIDEVPYIEVVQFFNSGNIPENFKRSGSYVYKPIPLKGIQIMQYFLSHAPNKDASIWFQSLVGAVENLSPHENRKAIIAQEYITSWKCDDEENRNIRWVKDSRENLDPYTLGDYVNWPDIDIKNWQTSYYGSNFQRLRKIKTIYDPCNVFRFQQSIPPFHM
ncbi:TPA: BBE domain-containing protein [Bacillus cereus]